MAELTIEISATMERRIPICKAIKAHLAYAWYFIRKKNNLENDTFLIKPNRIEFRYGWFIWIYIGIWAILVSGIQFECFRLHNCIIIIIITIIAL